MTPTATDTVSTSWWGWLIPHPHPLNDKTKVCQLLPTLHPASRENTRPLPLKPLLRHFFFTTITRKYAAAAACNAYAGALVSTLTLMML